MKRKRRSIGVIAFIIFVILVSVSGYALKAAGYENNPFDQIAFLSNWTSGGEGQFEQRATDTDGSNFSLPPLGSGDTSAELSASNTTGSQLQLPPVSDLSASDTNSDASPSPNAGAPRGGGPDEENSISWSDIGDVLYNLWFICAITAVFIVVQQIFKFSIKQFKSRRLPRMATAK